MGLLSVCFADGKEIHLSFLAAKPPHKQTQLELVKSLDKFLSFPLFSGMLDVFIITKLWVTGMAFIQRRCQGIINGVGV